MTGSMMIFRKVHADEYWVDPVENSRLVRRRRKKDDQKGNPMQRIINIEHVAAEIVAAAIQVQRTLAPGLLESVYQKCCEHDLRSRGLAVEGELSLPVTPLGQTMDAFFRIDMQAEKCMVVENKAVDKVLPIHTAQWVIYRKLNGNSLGFRLNWSDQNGGWNQPHC